MLWCFAMRQKKFQKDVISVILGMKANFQMKWRFLTFVLALTGFTQLFLDTKKTLKQALKRL